MSPSCACVTPSSNQALIHSRKCSIALTYGIYACGAFGGQTEFEQFTFSAAYGYEIVDGKLGEMVRDVVLTGNVFQTLRNIEMIGNDFGIAGGARAAAGKADKRLCPSPRGAPHVRIRDVIVGGR
jgi:TldD protein